MASISALIIETIVQRQFQKQLKKVALRKVGANKVKSLINRFDKRKTFITNLKDKPLKMVEKVMKEYAKRKLLGLLPPLRYINNYRKYGIKQCMVRLVFKATPTELKIPYYFIKGCKDQFEKVAIMKDGKQEFWKKLGEMDQKHQARTLNTIINFKPQIKELKDYWDFVLDKQLIFNAHSPMTHNFDRLPMYYNIKKQELFFYARGYAGKMLDPILIPNVPWELVFRAMKGADFGKAIYSQIRSVRSLETAKKWAMRDPYYHPKTKR